MYLGVRCWLFSAFCIRSRGIAVQFRAPREKVFTLSFFPIFFYSSYSSPLFLVCGCGVSLCLRAGTSRLLRGDRRVLRNFVQNGLSIMVLIHVFLKVVVSHRIGLPFRQDRRVTREGVLMGRMTTALRLVGRDVSQPSHCHVHHVQVGRAFIQLRSDQLIFTYPCVRFSAPLFRSHTHTEVD